MFSLIKGAMSFAVFLVLAYGLFFLHIGGQSVASHIHDIWRSTVVQDKIGAIKDDVRGQLEARLEEAEREAAVELGREILDRGVEISDEDKEKLESLLRAEIE